MKRGFGSDNHSGICPEVLKAISDANINHALAYGDDEYCERVEVLFKKHFGEQSSVYFVLAPVPLNTKYTDDCSPKCFLNKTSTLSQYSSSP